MDGPIPFKQNLHIGTATKVHREGVLKRDWCGLMSCLKLGQLFLSLMMLMMKRMMNVCENGIESHCWKWKDWSQLVPLEWWLEL